VALAQANVSLHLSTLQNVTFHDSREDGQALDELRPFPGSNTLQRTATHCNALQRTATHCNALQRTATHCNTLQRRPAGDKCPFLLWRGAFSKRSACVNPFS